MVRLNTHSLNKNEIMIDVRERDEFEAEHVEGSIHVPLSNFSFLAPGILSALSDRKITIMCRSGNRAKLARNQFVQLGFGDITAEVFEGGILAWKKAGKATIQRKKDHLPVLRQVQIAVGSSVVLFSLLSLLVNPAWSYATGFFGAGLLVAGSTGFCGMAELIARLPWNRAQPGNQEELCKVSPASGSCGC